MRRNQPRTKRLAPRRSRVFRTTRSKSFRAFFNQQPHAIEFCRRHLSKEHCEYDGDPVVITWPDGVWCCAYSYILESRPDVDYQYFRARSFNDHRLRTPSPSRILLAALPGSGGKKIT